MRKNYFFLLLILSFLCSNTKAQITLDSTVLDTTTIITGIDIPWEITWGPDNWIWMTERYGRISRVNPEDGTQDVLLDLSPSVYAQAEAGLLGMVLHPDFNDTPQVFVAYTYLDGTVKERMVRYEYNGTTLVNPLTIVEDIPGSNTHNGSRLLILPDYTLLMTTGDAQIQASSQIITELNGKTLRFNLDGSIPLQQPHSR